MGTHNPTEILLSALDIEKFLSIVRPEERNADDCWPWPLSGDKDGYGLMYLVSDKKIKRRAPRISFTIFNGSIPPGEDVLHSCDTPPCVNPKHLTAGSPKKNTQDMIGKKRHSHGPSRSALLSGKQALGEEDIPVIRSMRKEGMTFEAIGNAYDRSKATIRDICIRKTWHHIP